MTVAESVAAGLARAAVQRALATWTADRRLADERRKQLSELLPQSVGDRFRRTDSAGQLQRLIHAVDTELEQWVRSEMSGLDAGDRSAALTAVMQAFDRANLSDDALAAIDFDAGKLARSLRTEFAEFKRAASLSEAAGELHDRVLERSCELIVQMVQQVPAFLARSHTAMLSRLTTLEKQGTELLDRLPVRPHRSPPEYWATVREIHARTPRLVSRHLELGDITALATGQPGYRWLIGGPWAGKTSLLAEAATTALPSQVDVVAYFASRREADADGNRFLAAVVPQLEHLLDEEPMPPNRHRLRSLWERAGAKDRPLLLVVDGLDEDVRPPGVPSIASLLPARLGANGHVLVASRPHPELPADVDVGHPLRATTPIPLSPSPEASHLASLAQQELRELLRGEHAEFAAEVFGILAAARGPMAVADVVAILGMCAPVSAAARHHVLQLMIEDAARSLQPVGPANRRRYTFAHDQLLEQAMDHPGLSHPEYRGRIHRWARSWAEAGWPLHGGCESATPRYLLDSYPAVLKDDPTRLTHLAADPGWVVAALHTVGVDRLLADLLAVTSEPKAASQVAVLRTQASTLRPPHPVNDPRYLMRQLCLGALELDRDGPAGSIRERLKAQRDPGPVPTWTSRRVSPALNAESSDHGGVWAVAMTRDGRVVSAGEGGVMTWNPAVPGAAPAELGRHDDWVRAVAVVPDGRVVSAGADGRVLVWDPVVPGAAPAELGRHDDWGWAVAVAPDGRVVSGGANGRLLLWDPAVPGAAPAELGRHPWGLQAVAVAPDGRVVSAGSDGRVLLWDRSTPDSPIELGRLLWGLRAVAVAPDGRVVSAGSDGRVLLWDPAAPGTPINLGHHGDWVRAVAVAVGPDGRVVSGGADGRLLVWDPAAPGSPIDLGRHDGGVRALAVAPDGRVISAGADQRVRIWSPTKSGAAQAELGHGDWVQATAVAVGQDGRLVSGGADGRLLLWDPAAPGPPMSLGRHDGAVRALTVASDGRVVSAGADQRVRIWNPAAPSSPLDIGRHRRGVRAVAANESGQVVSSGDDGWVSVWDPNTPRTPIQLGRHRWGVRALAATADGRVISGGNDGRVLAWDPATPGSPIELGYHYGAVRAVAAAADGKVISAGADQRVLMWDPATEGAVATELGRHDDWVRAVAAAPDGRVVSVGADQRICVWDPSRPGVQAEMACAVTAIAFASNRTKPQFALAHEGHGISMWSLPGRSAGGALGFKDH